MEWYQGQSVGRAELESALSSSESPDPDEVFYLDNLAEHYGPLPQNNSLSTETQDLTHDDSDNFEFRLFSNTITHEEADANGHDGPRKVALRSPTPVQGDGSFVVARRPKAYYFTGQMSKNQAWQYREATISGEEIVAGLATKWKGSELPWRVLSVASSIRPQATSANGPVISSNRTKKTRKSKKNRIALRLKIAESDRRKSAEQKQQAEKEEAEKLKRMTRNREKKLKRRQKKRETKAAQPAV